MPPERRSRLLASGWCSAAPFGSDRNRRPGGAAPACARCHLLALSTMPVSAGKRGVLGSVGAALVLALTAFLLLAASASASSFSKAETLGGDSSSCPPIKNKPDAIPHVDYNGVRHITYCVVPVNVHPGQNIIRLRRTDLFPKV